MTMSDSHPRPPHFPPPWNLTGEAYVIPTSNPSESNPGVYGQLEARSDFADEKKSGKFKGGIMGFGFVQIIRYHTSPVGPYDELAYIPGWFETPGGNRHLRATNVYVSSEASIYNGRHNWNIPKHPATFTFTQKNRPDGLKQVHIKVSQPHMDGSKPNPPFFSVICTLNPYRYNPSLPFNTDYIPFMNVIFTQPPLPGLHNSSSEVSTNQWRTFKSTMKGRASLMSVQSTNESDDGRLGENLEYGEFADGVHFGKVRPAGGVYLRGMDIMVLEPFDESEGTI